MRVGFLHVGADTQLARLMVESVRSAMPGVAVTQMSDGLTASRVEGVDEVRDLPYHPAWGGRLMTYRMRHLADLPQDDWLILDTDVIVQKNVDDVFCGMHRLEIDATLTRRRGVILDERGVNLVERMPYNSGVMFCRSPRFWARCLEVCESLPLEEQRWFGDQLSLVRAAPDFSFAELPCEIFNYSPDRADEDLSHVAIVHYKGKRKKWMLERKVAA